MLRFGVTLRCACAVAPVRVSGAGTVATSQRAVAVAGSEFGAKAVAQTEQVVVVDAQASGAGDEGFVARKARLALFRGEAVRVAPSAAFGGHCTPAKIAANGSRP
jgi:hypothetical protein